jgi:hypothetical protein
VGCDRYQRHRTTAPAHTDDGVRGRFQIGAIDWNRATCWSQLTMDHGVTVERLTGQPLKASSHIVQHVGLSNDA